MEPFLILSLVLPGKTSYCASLLTPEPCKHPSAHPRVEAVLIQKPSRGREAAHLHLAWLLLLLLVSSDLVCKALDDTLGIHRLPAPDSPLLI